jgi:hypothetical protein
VTCSCCPSYLGGLNRRIPVQGGPGKNVRLLQKWLKQKGCGCSYSTLLRKCEALSSNPSIAKEKEKQLPKQRGDLFTLFSTSFTCGINESRTTMSHHSFNFSTWVIKLQSNTHLSLSGNVEWLSWETPKWEQWAWAQVSLDPSMNALCLGQVLCLPEPNTTLHLSCWQLD